MAPPNVPNDPEYIKLKDFLIEKTKDVKSPLNIKQLAEEFKEKSRSSHKLVYLRLRIYTVRSTIHQMDSVDKETKLKMLFALSAPIDEDFLNELRKDAVVEVDEKRRITKYEANDGSLELEGDHNQSAKEMPPPSTPNTPAQIDLKDFLIEKTKDVESPFNIEQLADEYKEKSGSSHKLVYLCLRIYKFRSKIHGMDSIDAETKLKMLFALSAPIDENYLNEIRKDAYVEVDEKQRIAKYKANDGSLEMEGDHSGFQDSILKTPESVKRANAAEASVFSKKAKTGEVKSEDHTPDDIEDSQSSTALNTGVIKSEGVPVPVASESERAHRGTSSTADPESESDDYSTPQIKFLGAIQSFVSILDTPSLTPLQAKIEEKLRQLSPNEKIPNEVMSSALELMVAKIAHQSVVNISENVESASLSHFLCYLKAAVMNSKLEGLEMLMEKIKKRIKEPTSKDKSIAVEKMASALQATIDAVGF